MTTKVINPKTLRKSNKVNIKFILWSKGDMSRLQLAKELKLTKASITQIVNDLVYEGEVEEIGNVEKKSAGRPEVLLRLNTKKHIAIGLNIENDKTHISICTLDTILEDYVYPTAEKIKDVQDIIELLKPVVKKWRYPYAPIGIGVGIVGIVEKGVSVNSYGILPNNSDIKKALEAEFDMPVKVINNIHAQARVLLKGSEDNFMLIKHSPGIGCAIISNGKVLGGEHLVAGEIGHVVVEKNGLQCRCGKKGCLEAYTAEWHIEDLYYTKTNNKLSVSEIYDKYGIDKIATEILEDAIQYLVLAIANTSTIIDPKHIIVTGGLFNNDRLYDLVIERVRELGLKADCDISRVADGESIKAFAGAKDIIMNKILEV